MSDYSGATRRARIFRRQALLAEAESLRLQLEAAANDRSTEALVECDTGCGTKHFVRRDLIAAWTRLHVLDCATLKDLRSQLAAVTAERDAARWFVELGYDEREAIRRRLEQLFEVHGTTLPSLLSMVEMAWEHGKQHRADAEAAAAEVARMRPVVEAAAAWRAMLVRDTPVTLDEVNAEALLERKLVAAVDTYREARNADA